MAFVDTATLCFKPWDAIINFDNVKNFFFLSPSKKVTEALKRES